MDAAALRGCSNSAGEILESGTSLSVSSVGGAFLDRTSRSGSWGRGSSVGGASVRDLGGWHVQRWGVSGWKICPRLPQPLRPSPSLSCNCKSSTRFIVLLYPRAPSSDNSTWRLLFVKSLSALRVHPLRFLIAQRTINLIGCLERVIKSSLER